MLKAAEGFAPATGPCGIWGTTGTTTAAAAALTQRRHRPRPGAWTTSGALTIPAPSSFPPCWPSPKRKEPRTAVPCWRR